MRTMVLEYLPTFARTKSPSFVGKYASTMEHMGMSTTFQLLWFLISTGEHGQSLIVQEILSFKVGWSVSVANT